MPSNKISVQSAKAKLGLRKKLETSFDEHGRVCTSCGVYKKWAEFNTHRRSTTGKTSSCKKCKNLKRKSAPRDIKREKYCAKIHRKNLKKCDPYLIRARSIRSSLMRRGRENDLDRTNIPTAEVIKSWLEEQKPLKCYYSGIDVDLWKMHIDHKVPLSRGGSNCLSNLCVTDSKINSAKGAMTEDEFVALYELISSWEDGGTYVLSRLRMGHFGKLK
jgi:5-methylcytosine-specific restriction endonuclease McrA